MAEVKLKYNPYTKEKTLWIDGKEQDKAVTQNICGADGHELSEWSGSFYKNMLDKCNDDFAVHFSGIERDYEFLEDSLKRFLNANSGINAEIKLEKEKIVKAADRLNKLKDLFAKMQKQAPFEQLKTEAIKNLFDKAVNSEFEMAVVATMSSGKSTLINAILGQELLPAKNEATTATIARIHDMDGIDHFHATSYDADDNELAECDPLTHENMEELNDIDKAPTSRIEIYGDIPGIESKNIKLVLTDTPGPNNSRTSEHHKHTMDLLNSDYKPMIIYVLNATQLEANDDNMLLSSVAEIMKNGDRQSSDRFIFVLNKADAFDPGKGELISKKIDDTKAYLKNHGIKDARVFPTAAWLAKIIRQEQNGFPLTADEEDTLETKPRRFVKDEERHLSNYASFLSPATRSTLDQMIDNAKSSGDINKEALFYTGVPSVELALTEYLSKYALPAKIAKGVETFKYKIDALNIEANEINKLEGNLQKAKDLKTALQNIKTLLDNGGKAQELKTKIENLSAKDKLDDAMKDAQTKLGRNLDCLENSEDKKFSLEQAKYVKLEVQRRLDEVTEEYKSSVEKALNDSVVEQGKLYVQEYNRYISGLVTAADFELSSASILGDFASMNVTETMEEYSQTESVKTGSHLEKNKGARAAVARFLHAKSFFGKRGLINVDDYEDKDFVHFKTFWAAEILPSIENFTNETKEEATAWIAKEEAKFKSFFLKKFDELDKAIKAKLEEQEAMLADKQKFEQMIDTNKKNLAWLEAFKKDLDNILEI